MGHLKQTPSQTAGPYLHIGLAPDAAGFAFGPQGPSREIAGPEVIGTRIRIEGFVLDATGSAVKDAVLEAWQADARGRYAHPEGGGPVETGFGGWARAIADFESGKWEFDTIKPGPVMRQNGQMMAPHISLWLVARGINAGLHTRLYFDDEEADNSADPVLRLIAPESRRPTLIARRIASDLTDARPVYRFDIRIQGEDETVFFDI